MSGEIRNATTALERALTSALPLATRSYVSVGRPGWSWRDLLGSRVNLCLVQVREDRGRTNDLLPARPAARAVSLTYLVTFYGNQAEDRLQAVLEMLVKDPHLMGSGEASLTASVQNLSVAEQAELWGMFRRKYALSMAIEVSGAIVGASRPWP